MRKTERMYPFLAQVMEVWMKVPDWRFGQLMSNFFSSLSKDPFFMDEEEFIAKLKEYIDRSIS